MENQTQVAVIANQSAFAKQNLSMGDLFAKRLQDIFSNNIGNINIKSFGTEECTWSGIVEKITFDLANGQNVVCQITTPKNHKGERF